MAQQSQNSWLLLSSSLEGIRSLTNESKINTLTQDKEYLKLAEQMAAISRYANTCAGVYFSMHMNDMINKEKTDGPSDVIKGS